MKIISTIILFQFFCTILLMGREVNYGRFDFRSDPESKARFQSHKITIWGANAFPVKSDEKGAILTLSNSRISYSFFLFGKEDVNGNWYPKVGMPKPSKANWNSNDFFSFTAGKIKSKECNVKIVAEDNSSFTLQYTKDDFQGKAKFQIFPDDDKLYFSFESNQVATVQFSTFPSSTGGTWKSGLKLRKRFGVTPLRNLENGKYHLKDKEYYLFLGDQYFDPAQNRGEGPCGILYNPILSHGVAIVGNYGCTISLQGKKKIISAILFDFHGQSNKSALTYLGQIPVEFKSVIDK